MSATAEIKTIAVRARHAFEELTLDCAYTEANRLYSTGPGAMFRYLKGIHGGRWRALRYLRQVLRDAGEVVPQVDKHDIESLKNERRRICKDRLWVLEEAVYGQKEKEAVARFASLNDMLAYLRSSYSDLNSLLLSLRSAANRERRKTQSLEAVHESS